MPEKDTGKLISDISRSKLDLFLMNNIADAKILKKLSDGQLIDNKFRFYEFLPIGYVTIDETGRIKTANQAAVDLFGTEKSHLVDKDFIDFIHREDQKKFQAFMNPLSDSPHPSFDLKLIKNQNFFWVRMNILVDILFNFPGRQIRLIFHDITELKQLEQENLKLKLQLQQIQKMEAIGEFSSGIAHDFNNILHPIMGSLELLIEDTIEDRKLQKRLKNILAGANRASSLVKQILNFTHNKNSAATPIKIQSIIREVLQLSRATLPSTIKIIQTIDNGCGPVMADPTHIYQIAMNLITNAYHAMGDEGGILDVTLKELEITETSPSKPDIKPGRYICLGVADTGTGIDDTIANKIFDPYFTTKEKGTGLGLSVIFSIVKNFGGDISFTTEPGKGSLFQVYLPRAEAPFETLRLSGDKQKDLHGRESILFVDDEPFNVKAQQKTFERYGYRVTAFVSSLEALNEFKARPDDFDIVICDMTMPDMDGLLLSNKIKQIKPHLPIILYTGFSNQVNKDNYKDLGLDGFLMKPVRKDDSLKLIRHLLDNR